MKRILYIYGLLLCSPVYSQGVRNIWLVGYAGALDSFTSSTRATIDFKSGTPNVIPTTRKMRFLETQGNITNNNGNLIMSSNGIWIANATGDTMSNGNDLNPSAYTNSWKPYGLPLQHANIILPWPGDSTKYILFHHIASPPLGYRATELFYSVIDMTLDNGKGGVTLKNQIAFQDTLSYGISACKHANGRDWWVVIVKDNSDIIYKLLLTPDGIDTVTTQSFGGTIAYYGSSAQPEFSPDGRKFAFTTGYGTGGWSFVMYVNYFEFDRCTGMFSNFQSINITHADSLLGLSTMFSANSKYLYASTVGHIYQINTDSAVLVVDTIATYDGYENPPGVISNFWLMYRAADNKIYFASQNGAFDLTVINHPDSGGLSCDVQQHSFHIPCYNAGTVPNHPNYFLGAEAGSVCDTLTSLPSLGIGHWSLSIAPNPASTMVTLNAQQVKGKEAVLYIFNTMGEEIGRREVANNGGYITQDVYVGGLGNGIYIVKLQTERNVYSAKFVKQ